MMRLTALTILAAFLFLTACSSTSSHYPPNRTPVTHHTIDSLKAPATALSNGPAAIAHLTDAKITAYRLARIDEPKPGEGFHGHEIVGTRVIESPELRGRILKALTTPYNYNEMYRYGGQPSLGLRIEQDSTVTDFVIGADRALVHSYWAKDAGWNGLSRVGVEVFNQLNAELAGALALSPQQ